MRFYHEHFGLNIPNIDSPEFSHIFVELKKQYSRIPNTKCLFCPGCEIVVATCCKNFNPAMNLVEFMSILKIINSEWTDEDRKKLLYKCFETYLNPNMIKPCPLLAEDNRCPVYMGRPSGCRYYGQYSKKSWNERMKSVSNRLGVSIDKLPMKGEQCSNIAIEGKKRHEAISKETEDDSFEKIFMLDKHLFDDEISSNFIVNQGLTYLTFDAHYLLYRTGPDNLEVLTDIRMKLDEKKEKFENGELEEEDLREEEKKVEDFLKEVKKNIFTNDTENEEKGVFGNAI